MRIRAFILFVAVVYIFSYAAIARQIYIDPDICIQSEPAEERLFTANAPGPCSPEKPENCSPTWDEDRYRFTTVPDRIDIIRSAAEEVWRRLLICPVGTLQFADYLGFRQALSLSSSTQSLYEKSSTQFQCCDFLDGVKVSTESIDIAPGDASTARSTLRIEYRGASRRSGHAAQTVNE